MNTTTTTTTSLFQVMYGLQSLCPQFSRGYSRRQYKKNKKIRTEEMKRNSQNMFGTLQDSKKPFQINWKVLKKCKPYSNIRKNAIFVLMKRSSSFVTSDFVEISSCVYTKTIILFNLGD